MNKLSINLIEKKLNKKIRKDTVSIGFDVAEHYTGICVLKTNTNELIIESLQKITTNPKEDIINRMEYFINALEKFKQDLHYKEFRIVVIEDCWFGMNVNTLKSLARFSTLIYVAFRKNCDYKFFILPNSARSQIGFNKNDQIAKGNVKVGIISKGKNKGKPKKIDIKLLVQDYLKTEFGLIIKDLDEVDGFVLSLAGLLK